MMQRKYIAVFFRCWQLYFLLQYMLSTGPLLGGEILHDQHWPTLLSESYKYLQLEIWKKMSQRKHVLRIQIPNDHTPCSSLSLMIKLGFVEWKLFIHITNTTMIENVPWNSAWSLRWTKYLWICCTKQLDGERDIRDYPHFPQYWVSNSNHHSLT